MTREDWIKNNSKCNGGNDFDVIFLKKLYERISKSPFRLKDDPAEKEKEDRKTFKQKLASTVSFL